MAWKLLPVAAFADLRDEWQRLARERHADHPLLDARFVGACLTCFGRDTGKLAVEEENGTVRSMLLLEKTAGWDWQAFSPSQLPICPLVSERSDLMGALRDLVRLRSFTGLLGLMRYDPKYYADGDWPQVERVPYATTMEVATDGGFAAYWAARHKKLRDNIGRYSRRAANAGHTVRLETLGDADTMPDAVRRYAEIESRGWKGEAGSAIGVDNLQGKFYGNVMTEMAATGDARVLELWFGDVLVASRLLISRGGIAVFLKTTYREEFSDFAAGRLLLHSALEELFRSGTWKTIEFYTNASADQLQWATASRPLAHLNVLRGAAIEKLLALRRRFAKPPAG